MKFVLTVKREWVKFLISIVVAWTLLLMHVSKTLGGDNMIYAIGEMHAYNPNLFSGNVYLGEGTISPRYVIDELFRLIMLMNGGNWAGASLLWIYFGAFIQSIGIANIAKQIHEEYQIAVSGILACAIFLCGNFLAGFGLVVLESTSIGVALAFSFLSISFIISNQKNYSAAWIFAACASICHVHEGIYCCAIVLLFAVADSIMQRRVLLNENKAIIIAAVSLLLVTCPSMFTDRMDVSGQDFVYIYSVLRHPHHLVPSSWGIDAIYKTITIDIGLFLLSVIERKLSDDKTEKFYLISSILLGTAWILAVNIMYLFTEIKPIAAISTLFLSKSFKYVLLIALIWGVDSSLRLRDRGRIMSSYCLLYCAFFAASYDNKQVVSLFIIVYMIMFVEDYLVKHNVFVIPKNHRVWMVADFCFFVITFCLKRADLGVEELGFIMNLLVSFKSVMVSGLTIGLSKGLTIVLVFCAIFVISFAIKRSGFIARFICVVASICMIVISFMGRVIVYDNESISWINGDMALRASIGDELFTLAQNFRDCTDVTTSYIADPDDTVNTGWFQVVCERNCYCVYKVVPSSKSVIDDWYNRYLKVSTFNEKTGEEIKDIMDAEGVRFLLVSKDNYSKYEFMDTFSVYLSSPLDTYRIYELS